MTNGPHRTNHQRVRFTSPTVYLYTIAAILFSNLGTHGFVFNTARHENTLGLKYQPALQGVIVPLPSRVYQHWQRQRATCMYLVTEDDVLEAVEDAENLWAQALEARKTANALSDRAEEEAEAAAETAKEIDALFQEQRENRQSITMQQLAQADTAARTNLDAGNLVNRALRASEEADQLEKLAEEALRKSEERLEQHLKDFPNSSLAL